MKKSQLALAVTSLSTPCFALAAGIPVISDSEIKLYGFVRADGTYDMKGNNTGSSSNPGDWGSFLSTQPIDGSPAAQKTGYTYLTARTSRFGFDGKLAGGAVGFKLEGDFNGTTAEGGRPGGNNGTGLRIRHAYIETQGWLVGQSWTNYEDLASLPETVQFNPSLTAAAPRQAQARYTFDLGDSKLSLAVENTDNMTYSGNDFARGVDLSGRWTKTADWGHVSARVVSTQYRTISSSNVTHSARGYQAGFSGSFKLTPADTLGYGIFSGNGGGRYAWGSLLQGAVDTPTGISLFKTKGYHIGYTHNWSSTLRSNLAYSYLKFQDNPNALVNFDNKKLSQLHANVIAVVAKNTELGVEYAYGKRWLMDAAPDPLLNPLNSTTGVEQRINMALTTMF